MSLPRIRALAPTAHVFTGRRVVRSLWWTGRRALLAACAFAAGCSSGGEPLPPPEPSPRLVASPALVSFWTCAGAMWAPSPGAQHASVRLEGSSSDVAVSIRSISYTVGVSDRYDDTTDEWLTATLDRSTTPATLTLAAKSEWQLRGTYVASVVLTTDAPGVEPTNLQATMTVGECVFE